MILTEQQHIKPNHKFYKECDELCYISKNLYNASLYKIRQHLFKNDSFIIKDKKGNTTSIYDYVELYHQMKNSNEYRTKNHKEYNEKNVSVSPLQQVFIQLNKNFTGFIKANKEFKINSNKFNGKPKLPKYKKRDGRNEITFNKQAILFKKNKGYAKLSGTDILIPLKHKANKENIKEIKICPSTYGYNIIISYKGEDYEIKENNNRYASIDIGINNLMTLTSNDSEIQPIIINGRPIKSMNQYFNKKKSIMQSNLSSGRFSSKNIKRFTQKRNHKINDYMHKASRTIVNYLIDNNITCLVLGYNKGWKDSINIGKKTNQNFVGIPFYKIKNQLKYKCEMNGIEFIDHEESYTSKCSFLDMEEIKKHSKYKGKRIKRGLFKSKNGLHINADMNGSLNILRKVAGDEIFLNPVEDYAVNPMMVTCHK